MEVWRVKKGRGCSVDILVSRGIWRGDDGRKNG